MATTTVDGRPVLVTVADRLRMWDPATGEPIAELTPPGFRTGISRVACTELDGRPVAVAACHDGALLLWDLAERALVHERLGGDTGGVGAMACTDLDGRRVALVGDYSGIVRVWDLAAGTMSGAPVVPAPTLCNCSVRFWDLRAGRALDAPVPGDWTGSVACTRVHGRAVAVTGGSLDVPDGADVVRVWDVATGTPVGGPLTGHTATIGAMACAHLDDRPVAVSGDDAGVVRVWDLEAVRPVGEPVPLPALGRIRSIACTTIGGRPVAAVAGDSATVLILDLAEGAEPGPALHLPCHVTALTAAPDGRIVVALGSDIAVFGPGL